MVDKITKKPKHEKTWKKRQNRKKSGHNNMGGAQSRRIAV